MDTLLWRVSSIATDVAKLYLQLWSKTKGCSVYWYRCSQWLLKSLSMFSWLTVPGNNTAEGNSLLANPRSGCPFPGCFLSINLLFSLTSYLFSQLCFPICQFVQVALTFPISLVSGVSSSTIILHCGVCGRGFPFSSSQSIAADCSPSSGNGEEGKQLCLVFSIGPPPVQGLSHAAATLKMGFDLYCQFCWLSVFSPKVSERQEVWLCPSLHSLLLCTVTASAG